MTDLRAPFPWFGGKRPVADLVWAAFGDVANYVEPFAGSLAVLLSRPTNPRVETVNDIDCYLANFWRAVKAAPGDVAVFADWPVNEADLHARHRWLVDQIAFRERMKTEPDFYDAKIAGWWVWGLSSWIGSGWCAVNDDGSAAPPPSEATRTRQRARYPSRQLPELGSRRGVNRDAFHTATREPDPPSLSLSLGNFRICRARRRASIERLAEVSLTTSRLDCGAFVLPVATGLASWVTA